MRNILVTGGAGFIGSHVVCRLVQDHPELNIYNFDKLDYCASIKNLDEISGKTNYQFIKGDVTSIDFVNYIIKEKQIDTIMHFAAQSHVDNSFGDSFAFTQTNVMGTHILLEAARMYKIKRFIYISTDEVYGEAEAESPLCKEESILSPTNPYSATKAAAENLAKAYQKSFNLPIIITRSNNVYGGGQFPEKIIPKFICSLLRGHQCYIHGDGHNSRHYIHTTDVTSALITVLHKGHIGETYNIGTDFEISNVRLARYLLILFNVASLPNNTSVDPRTLTVSQLIPILSQPLEGEEKYLQFVADRPFNDRRYAIDSTKIGSLGWAPKMSFEQGVASTIEWYKRNSHEWWSSYDITASLSSPHPHPPPPKSDA